MIGERNIRFEAQIEAAKSSRSIFIGHESFYRFVVADHIPDRLIDGESRL